MGLSVEFCCLACTCGGANRGHVLSNSGERFAVGNGFVSGDWRSSRWCTVEVSSQRLWCKSVMSVQERCDEKSWGERSGSWQCGIPTPSASLRAGSSSSGAREVAHLTCPPEYSGAQVSAQKTGANLGQRLPAMSCMSFSYYGCAGLTLRIYC
jgi:hypothetical protein